MTSYPFSTEDSNSGAVKTSLKILSYNVWFREDLEVHKRMKAIGDLIQLHSPDLICFQVCYSINFHPPLFIVGSYALPLCSFTPVIILLYSRRLPQSYMTYFVGLTGGRCTDALSQMTWQIQEDTFVCRYAYDCFPLIDTVLNMFTFRSSRLTA